MRHFCLKVRSLPRMLRKLAGSMQTLNQHENQTADECMLQRKYSL